MTEQDNNLQENSSILFPKDEKPTQEYSFCNLEMIYRIFVLCEEDKEIGVCSICGFRKNLKGGNLYNGRK